MKTYTDSMELTNGLKVTVVVKKNVVKVDWKPLPPYDDDTLLAIKNHVDPWLSRYISHYEKLCGVS